eukprot:GFUD01010106.1.p1 GENE.GFUD01010106.1~~GFUD01010106.1.p1  ORF type:complete len:257 (+),score=86.91 GFUD01010106.1:153-923(+)
MLVIPVRGGDKYQSKMQRKSDGLVVGGREDVEKHKDDENYTPGYKTIAVKLVRKEVNTTEENNSLRLDIKDESEKRGETLKVKFHQDAIKTNNKDNQEVKKYIEMVNTVKEKGKEENRAWRSKLVRPDYEKENPFHPCGSVSLDADLIVRRWEERKHFRLSRLYGDTELSVPATETIDSYPAKKTVVDSTIDDADSDTAVTTTTDKKDTNVKDNNSNTTSSKIHHNQKNNKENDDIELPAEAEQSKSQKKYCCCIM